MVSGSRPFPETHSRAATPAHSSEVIGTFARSTAADVDAAVQAAVAVGREWMLTPAPERADYIPRAGPLLEERKEDIADVMTREMGKTLKEARGDIQEGIDFAFYIAGRDAGCSAKRCRPSSATSST